MSQVFLDYPPPANWQDFERITAALCKAIWGDDDAKTFGRPGQAQSGVDVVGNNYRSYPEARVGVQCKRRGQNDATGKALAGGLVKLSDVTDGLKDAKKLSPPLDHYVIATTAAKDEGFQQEVDTLSANRHRRGECRVTVWFWDWFQDQLNRHPEVAVTYFREVLQANNAYDMDRHVAGALRSGFNRSLMRTPFHSENKVGDVISAVRCLQHLLATGHLLDSDGNEVLSCPLPRKMRNQLDQQCVSQLERALQEFRDDVTECQRNGSIVQAANWLQVSEWGISDRLNERRASMLRTLNELLSRHDVPHVESPLLDCVSTT